MTENPYIEKLRFIKPQLKAMNVRRLRVFGSQARGQSHAGSDIDLLIDFEKSPTLFQMAHLQNKLEDELGIKVDLSTPLTLHPALKDKILGEARDV